MLPSDPTTVPPGDSDFFLKVFKIVENADGLGCTITLQASDPAYDGMRWAGVGDGVVQALVIVSYATPVTIDIAYDSSRTSHTRGVRCLGWWGQIPPGVDIAYEQNIFTSDKGKYVKVSYDATIVVEAYGHSSQLSNWALTGLDRFTDGIPIEGRPTRERIDLVLTNNAGTYTLTLSVNGYGVATGSRVGNGTITLTELNGSGVSGTVDVTYTADLALGTAYAIPRWPKAYKVYVDGVLTKTFNDIGMGNSFNVTVGPLTAGIHNFKVRAVSDTNVDGTLTADSPIPVPGRPLAPGTPVYLAGDYTNTQIRFLSSLTPGATYRVYVSPLNGPVDIGVIAATAVAVGVPGTDLVTIMLPSLVTPAAGLLTLWIAAVNGGVEDGEKKTLVIEYDASGVVVLPRPNIPGFKTNGTPTGRTITVQCDYLVTGEAGVGYAAQLFLVPDGSAVNWDTPVVESALPATPDAKGMKSTTLSYTAVADGYYQYAVRVRTQAPGSAPYLQSLNTQLQGPELLSSAVLAAPANVTLTVV